MLILPFKYSLDERVRVELTYVLCPQWCLSALGDPVDHLLSGWGHSAWYCPCGFSKGATSATVATGA